MIRYLVLGASAIALVVGGALGGTDVSIRPALVAVDSGTVFTVDIWKDSADIEFDGYETVVRFDPTMIELLSVAQETVMTNACGNTWWFPRMGEDSLFISHVLLCGGITVTGPGALSKIEFRALRNGVTAITSDYFWFTLAGIYDKDVTWHDGLVVIGDHSGIGDGKPSGISMPSLAIFPNPGRQFEIELFVPDKAQTFDQSGTLIVYDAPGRLVRSLEYDLRVTGRNVASWDGRDAADRALPAGVYFVEMRAGGSRAFGKAVKLD
jgi:hypothetical protein